MLMKSKIIVIVVAAIMIFAGFYAYTQVERNKSAPAKPLNVYPPDYQVVVNGTYNVPNNNAAYNNDTYTECIAHFYVENNVNFSNVCARSVCGKFVFIKLVNHNNSISNVVGNGVILCLDNKDCVGSGMVYGGHNNYRKSPRGCYGIIACSSNVTQVSVLICNYAGNTTFQKVLV